MFLGSAVKIKSARVFSKGLGHLFFRLAKHGSLNTECTMRKTSVAFFSQFTMHNPSFRAIAAGISFRSHSRICNITHRFLFPPNKFHPYQINQYSNLGTFMESPDENPFKEGKAKEKSELLMDFMSAETTMKMLEAFKDIEDVLEKGGELGRACLYIAATLNKDGKEPEKTLSFATKAYYDLSLNIEPSLDIAKSLLLMGTAAYRLKKFNDSLSYLNKADKALVKLDIEGFQGDDRFVIVSVQLELANVKSALGRGEEALEKLKKSVELKEKILDKNSDELGFAYHEIAGILSNMFNFKEALHYCLKALETHQYKMEDNSVEVAQDRHLLGVIYNGLGEHNKALEQHELSQKVLMKWGMDSEMIHAELDNACLQIDLGNHVMATDILKRLVPLVEPNSGELAMVFIFMGNALYHQEKLIETLGCLNIASQILNKEETVSPLRTSMAYTELALQYETMNHIGDAVSILKRAFSLLEMLPLEQHAVGSVGSRLGWLLISSGKESEAIPYLEIGVKNLEQCLGYKHFEVGSVYSNLGNAYLKLGRVESAVQMFLVAKDIMTTSLGFDHIDTIKACQNLAKGFAAMKNYSQAAEIQAQVVRSLQRHGPSVQDDLDESVQLLEQFTKNVPSLITDAPDLAF